MHLYAICLWRWIGVRPAVDVRVAEVGWTGLLRRGWRRGAAGLKRLPPGVDSRTVRCIARVVPDSRPIRPCSHSIDVVT